MISVEDSSLPGAGPDLKNAIWEAARPTIQEWTQMELRPVSEYGIRMYTTGMSDLACEVHRYVEVR
jgi:hypothetical protein